MAFFEQLRFEWILQWRRPYVHFCVAAFFLIAFSDTVQAGWQGQGGQWINGAAVICSRAVIYSLIGAIAIAGIVMDPFTRDRSTGVQELLLSTPASRTTLGLARYLVALSVVALATLMIAPGMVLATYVPGIPAELLGPTQWGHYAAAIGWLLAPNLFLVASLVFVVTSRWESRAAGFGAAAGAVALWVTTRMMLGRDIFRQEVYSTYALLDPFASIASFENVIGRTVAQNNEFFPPLTGALLKNRLFWMSIMLLLSLLGVALTPLRPRLSAGRRTRPAGATQQSNADRHATASFASSNALSGLLLFRRVVLWECRMLWRQPAAKVCIAVVAVTLWWTAASAVTQQFSLPSTDLLIHNTGYYFDKILVIAIAWIAGELLWRDDSLNTAELMDALPVGDITRMLARTTALLLVVAMFWMLSIAVNVVYQATHGYYRFEPWLYFTDSFVFKAPFYAWFALLAIALQAMVRHRHIAIALTLLVYIAEVLLDAVDCHHPMFRFGRVSHVWYSLMDGYGHFWQAHKWMLLYWTLGSIVIWLLGFAFVWRGIDPPSRRQLLHRRLSHPAALGVLAVCLTAFGAVAAHVWQESTVNAQWPPLNSDRLKAGVEKKYGPDWRGRPQPRVVGIRGDLDLYPAERRFVLNGSFTIENQTDKPIKELLIPATAGLNVERVSFEGGAELISHDTLLNVLHYRLASALAPGARANMAFQTSGRPPSGFAVHAASDDVGDVGQTEVIGNGTSLLNLRLMPAIGYTDRVEHKPAWKRRRHGLPEEWSPPEGVDALRQAHATLHLGWVESVDMTIRTDSDQTALHAGKLVRTWTEPNGRRGFQYCVDRASRGWCEIVSGRFEKRVFESEELPDVEVFYDPQHEASVEPFGNALRTAIDYFAEHYGPPPFEAFRLAEQSLHYDGFGSRSGMAFSSEVLGWKSNLRASGGEDINRMAALMAAMSWWGDQVIPANVAGAKILHAGLPYWTAALYLDKTRGVELSRRFRMQEAMQMFRGRSRMTDVEGPFASEFKDSTMIRSKGTFFLLYLADLIGHDRLEEILAEFLAECRHRPAPYPTASEFVAHLRTRMPPEHADVVATLFEEVNTWRLSVRDAVASRVGGEWLLSAKVETYQLKTEGWGEQRNVDIDVPITVAAYGDAGWDQASVLWLERQRLEPGMNTIEIRLKSKPIRFGVDPLLLLPDPNPHDNVRVVR